MSAPLPEPERPQLLRGDSEDVQVGATTKAELAAIYRRAGFTYGKIGERLGVGEGTVYRWLNRDAAVAYMEHDTARRSRSRRAKHLSPEMRQWIARRKREIAGQPLTAADKEQLARAMDDVGGA